MSCLYAFGERGCHVACALMERIAIRATAGVAAQRGYEWFYSVLESTLSDLPYI